MSPMPRSTGFPSLRSPTSSRSRALLSSNPGLIVGRKNLPAKDLQELIAWLKANPEKGDAGHPGDRRHRPHCRDILPKGDRYQISVHSLSRRHADDAGPAGGPGRHADRYADLVGAPNSRRRHQGLCRDVEDAAGDRARSSDRGRGRRPRSLSVAMERGLGAEANPSVRRRLADLGQTIYPVEQQTPDALAAFQRAEMEKWGPIIASANIKVE